MEREHEFRKRFGQLIRSATLLTTAYDAFSRSNIDAQILENNWSDLDIAIKSSLSRSLVVTYAKPFLTSRDSDATATMSKKYLTTAEQFDNDVHAALMELRNMFVAHANPEFEVSDARIFVSQASSDAGDPTVKRVYIPKALYFVSQGFLCFGDDSTLRTKLQTHTKAAAALTIDEMNAQAERIMNFMIEFADVSYLSEYVSIQEPTDPLPNENDVFAMESKGLKIGNVQRTNAYGKVGMPLGSVDFSNELFSIKAEADPKNPGSFTFNINFKNI